MSDAPAKVDWKKSYYKEGEKVSALEAQFAKMMRERDNTTSLWLIAMEQLAESQAREAKLRSILNECYNRPLLAWEGLIREALALPHDDSELREAIAKEMDAMAEEALKTGIKTAAQSGQEAVSLVLRLRAAEIREGKK